MQRLSGPDSRIVTTVRPKSKESEAQKEIVDDKGKSTRSVSNIPRLRPRQP